MKPEIETEPCLVTEPEPLFVQRVKIGPGAACPLLHGCHGGKLHRVSLGQHRKIVRVCGEDHVHHTTLRSRYLIHGFYCFGSADIVDLQLARRLLCYKLLNKIREDKERLVVCGCFRPGRHSLEREDLSRFGRNSLRKEYRDRDQHYKEKNARSSFHG